MISQVHDMRKPFWKTILLIHITSLLLSRGFCLVLFCLVDSDNISDPVLWIYITCFVVSSPGTVNILTWYFLSCPLSLARPEELSPGTILKTIFRSTFQPSPAVWQCHIMRWWLTEEHKLYKLIFSSTVTNPRPCLGRRTPVPRVSSWCTAISSGDNIHDIEEASDVSRDRVVVQSKVRV